jgi:hypothetical protein
VFYEVAEEDDYQELWDESCRAGITGVGVLMRNASQVPVTSVVVEMRVTISSADDPSCGRGDPVLVNSRWFRLGRNRYR